MANFCLVLLLFAIAAVANVQGDNMDDYLNRNKEKHDQTLKQMDVEIMLFEENSLAGLQTIDIKLKMLIDLLKQTNKKFDNLWFLNNSSQICVNHYRQTLPSEEYANNNTRKCRKGAEEQLPNLISEPRRTRKDLEGYYNKYDAAIKDCKKSYKPSTMGYSTCIQKAVIDADNYTNNMQRKFTTQMNRARGSGSANVNNALECSYSIEKEVISLISEAINSNTKCIEGKDICKKSWLNTCSMTMQMKASYVNSDNKFIPNPFYDRANETAKCVTLKFY